MNTVTVNAYAKVNLSLDIVGRRADGYHLMDMVMQAVSLHDTVILRKQPEGIAFSCSEKNLPQDESNLAVRAARAFFAHTGTDGGVRIALEKRIPAGAGMAGGSADAAAVLVGLNALYEAELSQETLCKIGLSLGADVPFCIVGGTARVTGIGEIIEPVAPLSSCFFAAVKPAFSISTKEAFARADGGLIDKRPDTDALVRAVGAGKLSAVGKELCNVFEQTEEVPVLSEVKKTLLSCGALGAAMTGSGSVIYGLFAAEAPAVRAAEAIRSFGKESYVFEPVLCGAYIAEME